MGTGTSTLVGVVALLVACRSRVADPIAPRAQPPVAVSQLVGYPAYPSLDRGAAVIEIEP